MIIIIRIMILGAVVISGFHNQLDVNAMKAIYITPIV